MQPNYTLEYTQGDIVNMATTYNNRIETELENGDKVVFHPETNTGQVYDFANGKWLDKTLEEITQLLDNTSYGDVKSDGSIAMSNITIGKRLDNSVIGVSSFAQGLDVVASGGYSHAEGFFTDASGLHSHAEGSSTVASGESAHAEGYLTKAEGYYSHAEGNNTTASNDGSHAEGANTTASGTNSHAEGNNTTAVASNSHAEGMSTTASGTSSHAEGEYTIAEGDYSHAEGYDTQANGEASHAEGQSTVASGVNSHAEGGSTSAIGNYSHSEGSATQANGEASHAEGSGNTASGLASHAEGSNNIAVGINSHVEGDNNVASSDNSHVEGRYNLASSGALYTVQSVDNDNRTITLTTSGITVGSIVDIKSNEYIAFDGATVTAVNGNRITVSGFRNIEDAKYVVVRKDGQHPMHVEGFNNIASGLGSHAEGHSVIASGGYSHAEGYLTKTTNYYSHAEGQSTTASGSASHAEGRGTVASASYSHAEGQNTTANGEYSHAEGMNTTASGSASHAEGYNTVASGDSSHSEGNNNVANGKYSHAEGDSNSVNGVASHSEGNNNVVGTGYSHAKGRYNLASNGTLYTVSNTNNKDKTVTLEHITGLSVGSKVDVKRQNLKALIDVEITNITGTKVTLNTSENINASTIVILRTSNVNSQLPTYVEGVNTVASGGYSHAEGSYTTASGNSSHSEGNYTTASGRSSHAEGDNTNASGDYSHASNYYTTAGVYASTAIGRYSKAMIGSATAVSNDGNDAFVIGNGTGLNSKSNAFRVNFAGATYGLSAFNSTGADYAEYFEWLDGNVDNEDRVGYVVTLKGDKIIKANNKHSYILGVISSNPSVIGDSYQDDWSGRYELDEWERKIVEEFKYEDIEFDEDGNEVKVTRIGSRFKANTNWNNEEEYIPREKRKEWSAVGLVGKLLVRDDGTCQINSFAKVGDIDGELTASQEPTNMRVMERVAPNIVRVFVK